MKDYWYKDYESLSEDQLTTRRFGIKINSSLNIKKEIDKAKTWIWNNISKMVHNDLTIELYKL